MSEVGRVLVRNLEALVLLSLGTGATKFHILLILLITILFDYIEHVQVLQRLSANE